MKVTLIAIALLLIIGISMAGIGVIGEIGFKTPIITDKEIPDNEYQELKIVLEKGNVVIDDKVGLDVKWKEISCKENKDENKIITGTTCEYELYKGNLFNGATINVTYDINAKAEDKQELLDQAIQDKVEFVKSVWETRQAKVEAEKDVNEPQTGTTKFMTDKK